LKLLIHVPVKRKQRTIRERERERERDTAQNEINQLATIKKEKKCLLLEIWWLPRSAHD